MKFKRIEHFDHFDTETILWADISCVPEEIQRNAREIDGEEYNPNGFGVCIYYSWSKREFDVVTNTDLEYNKSQNIYYIDINGDKHWFEAELPQEFMNEVFAACREELKLIRSDNALVACRHEAAAATSEFNRKEESV